MAERIWRRIRCWLTLNHLDPGVTSIEQTHTACKKCGKVWTVWQGTSVSELPRAPLVG